jgi:hypothetical protein
VILFLSTAFTCPIVDPSVWMTLRENANSILALGLNAVSMLLVTLAPSSKKVYGGGSCTYEKSGDALPLVNQGLMLCALVALGAGMAILLYDVLLPMVMYVVGKFMQFYSWIKGSGGENLAADQGQDGDEAHGLSLSHGDGGPVDGAGDPEEDPGHDPTATIDTTHKKVMV